MKTNYVILLLAVTAFSLKSCVSRVPMASPPQKVQVFENKQNKNSNFVRANEWMVESFNDTESVIQFTDKEDGIIKGSYVMKKGYTSTSVYISSTEPYYAIITITVKDNTVRIEIDPPSGMYSVKSFTDEYGFTPSMFNASADSLIENFKERITRKI
jgi:hypothetical protein